MFLTRNSGYLLSLVAFTTLCAVTLIAPVPSECTSTTSVGSFNENAEREKI